MTQGCAAPPTEKTPPDTPRAITGPRHHGPARRVRPGRREEDIERSPAGDGTQTSPHDPGEPPGSTAGVGQGNDPGNSVILLGDPGGSTPRAARPPADEEAARRHEHAAADRGREETGNPGRQGGRGAQRARRQPRDRHDIHRGNAGTEAGRVGRAPHPPGAPGPAHGDRGGRGSGLEHSPGAGPSLRRRLLPAAGGPEDAGQPGPAGPRGRAREHRGPPARVRAGPVRSLDVPRVRRRGPPPPVLRGRPPAQERGERVRRTPGKPGRGGVRPGDRKSPVRKGDAPTGPEAEVRPQPARTRQHVRTIHRPGREVREAGRRGGPRDAAQLPGRGPLQGAPQNARERGPPRSA